MKTIRLLMCAALPALFAACADNDLVSSPSVEAQDGNLVKLEKGFALAFTRGENAETRTAWQLGTLTGKINNSWIPDLAASAIVREDIGLAWRGEIENADVKTNYKFTLDGYLKKGETTPKFRNCNDELLIENGYRFGTVSTDNFALNEYNPATHTMTASDYSLKVEATGEWKMQESSADVQFDMYDADNLDDGAPNVRAGLFTTDNTTIFAGNYIVYFPYNPSFAKTGHLPAVSDKEFTRDVNKTGNLMAHLTGKTFAYGEAEITKGGSMAEGFRVVNLSTLIALNITNKTGEAQKIQKVILYDEGEESKGFYTSVGLDASKITEGATGQNLYVVDEETEYSPTLILNFVTGTTDNYATVPDNASQVGILAALPVNLEKPVAYVMFDDGLCVRKELQVKNLLPGDAIKWDITLNAADLDGKVSIAVDNKSFLKAWANVYHYHNNGGTEEMTIETLGDITFNKEDTARIGNVGVNRVSSFGLEAGKQPSGMLFKGNVTVTGKGTLTVPADVTCWFKGAGSKDLTDNYPTLTIENPIVIESEGCCGTAPGRLVLGNADTKNGTEGKGNYLIKSDLTNSGLLIVGPNNGVGTYTFEKRIINKNDTEYGSKPGEVDFCGATGNEIVVNGKIENDGIVELKDSVYNVPNAAWGDFDPATSNPQGVSVKANGGIDNKTEASRLRVDYLSKLSLGGSSVNNGEIEIIAKGQGANQSEDGTLTVEQGASLTNNKQIHNKGVFTNDNGTVNLEEGSEFVDFVGSQYSGVRATNNGGEYICEVDDARTTSGDRLAYALEDNMPTTVVRFVESTDGAATYTYNLNNYKAYDVAGKKLQTVRFEFDGNKAFVIDNDGNGSGLRNFGTGVTVKNATSVTFGHTGATTNTRGIKINGDLTGLEGAAAYTIEVKPKSTTAAFGTTDKDLEVTGNVSLAKNAEFKVDTNGRMEVDGNLTIGEDATAEFEYSSYTNVVGIIDIEDGGTFTRILSSGVAGANPAKVWCESYTKGSGAIITNGLPETR